MKVQNITDIEGFFKVVDSCEGKVELVTGEGDRLNLKSKLSQIGCSLKGAPFFNIFNRKGESYELCTSSRPYRVQPVGWFK